MTTRPPLPEIQGRILATLGPASEQEPVIQGLAEAGARGFRFNFSHGTPEQHLETLQRLRRVEQRLGIPLAAIQDLPGPKIRIGPVTQDRVRLQRGQEFLLYDTERPGDNQGVWVKLPGFWKALKPGDRVILGDGEIELEVLDPGPPVKTRVLRPGLLRSGKGVTLPAGPYLPSLGPRDRQLLQIGLQAGFDYIALSYVQHPRDLEEARDLLRDTSARLMVKIERREALDHLETLVELADAVIVARGDLGLAVDLTELPHLQRRIIQVARRYHRPVHVATQTMASMVEYPRPTRAEVTDVTLALLQGADGILLSDETAVGRYPVDTVAWARRILKTAEEHLRNLPALRPRETPAEALVDAAVDLAHRVRARCLIAPTTSGATALRLSSRRPRLPIFAVTPSQTVARQIHIAFGVEPVIGEEPTLPALLRSVVHHIGRCLPDLQPEDQCVILVGLPLRVPGNTNTLLLRRWHQLQTPDPSLPA